MAESIFKSPEKQLNADRNNLGEMYYIYNMLKKS